MSSLSFLKEMLLDIVHLLLLAFTFPVSSKFFKGKLHTVLRYSEFVNNVTA